MASLNKDQNLLLAAASNPILALEELGYEMRSGILPEIEDKLRFRPHEVAKLSRLRESIYKEAGKQFNIRSEKELNAVLFKDLNIRVFDEDGCQINKEVRTRQKGEEDGLDLYSDLHPIVAPLLAFREIRCALMADRVSNPAREIGRGIRDS